MTVHMENMVFNIFTSKFFKEDGKVTEIFD